MHKYIYPPVAKRIRSCITRLALSVQPSFSIQGPARGDILVAQAEGFYNVLCDTIEMYK